MNMKEYILNANPGRGQAAIFYLGQESILIKCGGKYILFDPYLTDYVDRNCSTDDVVWERNYPSPVDPAELDYIDYVFCSHDHGDHTDPETLSAIAAASPGAKFVGSRNVCSVYRTSCGIPEDKIIRVRADMRTELGGGLAVTPVPAAHEELHPDGEGSYQELGFIVETGSLRFYHAGDCCMYDGLAERIRGIDVAFMPINGRDYFRMKKNIIGNFDCTEAIALAAQAEVSLLVPLHFDLYDVNCVNPAHFVDCLMKNAPGQRFHIFIPGEKFIYEK